MTLLKIREAILNKKIQINSSNSSGIALLKIREAILNKKIQINSSNSSGIDNDSSQN